MRRGISRQSQEMLWKNKTLTKIAESQKCTWPGHVSYGLSTSAASSTPGHDSEYGARHQHIVKVRDHEVGLIVTGSRRDDSRASSRKAADAEKEQKREREQHGRSKDRDRAIVWPFQLNTFNAGGHRDQHGDIM